MPRDGSRNPTTASPASSARPERTRLVGRIAAVLPAAVACVVLLASLSAFHRFDRAAAIRDVTASAVFGDGVAFSPWKTVDGCGVEAPRTDCHFLLPDRTPGTLRYELEGEHALERIDLLDTQNRGYRDRGTSELRIELVGRDPVMLHASLPPHPRWHSVALGGRRAEAVVLHLDRFRGLGGGLDEVVIAGAPTRGLSRFLPWLVSIALALAAAFLARRTIARWHEPGVKSRVVLALSALVVILAGWDRLRFASGVSVFEWCLVFDVRELDSTARAMEFFRELMIPIPPVLALVEWLAHRATGSSTLVTRGLYAVSIVGSYLLALRLSHPSIPRMLATAAASVVLIAGTAAIHPGNPQVYDVVFPALCLSFVASLARAASSSSGSRAERSWAFVAGLALAVLGLTRPFGVLLVPAAVLRTLWEPRFRRPRTLVAFLLPVALLFGGYHLHLFRAHQQLTISNHAGFNLARAWPEAEKPPLVPERWSPPYRELNNPIHGQNSRRLLSAVRAYVLAHPDRAALRVAERLGQLFAPQTLVLPERFVPLEDWLGAYRWTVRALVLLFVLGLGARLVALLRRPSAEPERVDRGPPGIALDALFLLSCLAALATAFGETGEEGRFLIALLPMLAAAPATLRAP